MKFIVLYVFTLFTIAATFPVAQVRAIQSRKCVFCLISLKSSEQGASVARLSKGLIYDCSLSNCFLEKLYRNELDVIASFLIRVIERLILSPSKRSKSKYHPNFQ